MWEIKKVHFKNISESFPNEACQKIKLLKLCCWDSLPKGKCKKRCGKKICFQVRMINFFLIMLWHSDFLFYFSFMGILNHFTLPMPGSYIGG